MLPAVARPAKDNAKSARASINPTMPPVDNTKPSEHSHVLLQYNAEADGSIQQDRRAMQTSSDLEQVLHQCNKTFHEKRRAVVPPEDDIMQPDRISVVQATQHGSKWQSNLTVRHIPSVRFVDSSAGTSARARPTPNLYTQQTRHILHRYPFIREDDGVGDADYNEQQIMQDDDSLPVRRQWNDDWEDAELCGMVENDYYDDDLVDEDDASDRNGQPAQAYGIAAPRFWRPNRLY